MATAPQPAIEFTFQPEGHLYLDKQGQQIISVTQVLESAGLIDYDGVPEERMAFKRDIGNVVHSATAILETPDAGELDWTHLDPRCTPYVVAYERFREEAQFVATHVEWPGAVKLPQGNVAFTIDRIGTLGGYPAVIEVKAALKEEKSWRVQLAAYCDAILALGMKPQGCPTWKRIACQLKPDGSYKLFPYENRRDTDVWRWALALATWKLNEGFKLA